MRLPKLALCAALSSGFLLLPIPAVADPGSPGCVTRSEFGKVHAGMTVAQVRAVFGTAGTRATKATLGPFISEIRTYKACSTFSKVNVAYSAAVGQALTVSSKSAFWVG